MGGRRPHVDAALIIRTLIIGIYDLVTQNHFLTERLARHLKIKYFCNKNQPIQ